MSGYLLVFLRGEDFHTDARWGRTKADAGPRQACADRISDGTVIFSNPSGKDDEIDAAENGDYRCDLLTHRIAEHIDRQSCVGILG